MDKFTASTTRVLALIGAVATAFFSYDYFSRRAFEAVLEEEREKTRIEQERAAQYKTQLGNVLAEKKTTRFRLIQTTPGTPTPLLTLRVSQWNDNDEKVFSQDVQIQGRKIYFEGAVVHFKPEELLGGKQNLHLLTRVFSDQIPPAQGVLLLEQQIQAAEKSVAEKNSVQPFRRAEIQSYIQRLFLEPDFAKAEGVRTVNMQAVCDMNEISEDFVYTIVEKADGGYLIERQAIP